MKKMRFSGPQDYLAVLIRRKWWVIVPFVALSAFVVLLSTMLPKIYISQTTIILQAREVPTDLVKDLVSGTTEQRLKAVEGIILSRTNLLKIYNEFESDLTQYRNLNDGRKAAKLRGQISIEFQADRMAGRVLPITTILISCWDKNPVLAQKITSRLASLFIQQDNRSRESQIEGTTQFLTEELNKVAESLQQSSEELKGLKERYRYELPSELQTNLRTLDRLQVQKTGNLEALDRHMTMQLNLERMITDTPATISREAAARSQGTAPPPRNPQVEVYRKKEQELNDLLARGTEKHPDVQRLKAELAQLKQEIPLEDFLPPERAVELPEAAASVPNPAYQNLVSQLRQLKTEIEIRQREKSWIDAEMTRYSQRVQGTPRVEQEMAAIQRTTEDLTKQHDDLKAKLAAAKLSESLENQQRGSQFVVIDPANLPFEPATPRSWVFILVGMLLSLGVGLALAFLVAMLDPRIWTESELERFLGTAVLVEIPRLVSEPDLALARRRKLWQAAALAVSAGVYLGGLYAIYLNQSVFLRIFDPLIERMMTRVIS